MSQHRKSTLEKKILPPLQQGFEPVTFQSQVRRSNHWAIPAPRTFLFAQAFQQNLVLHMDREGEGAWYIQAREGGGGGGGGGRDKLNLLLRVSIIY